MRSSTPQKITDTTYKVEVDHPAQKQAFESSINEILDFFKKRLNNDFVTLKIDVSEKKENEKGMNPKEFLRLTIEDNPVLAQFLKEIDAELE